MSVGLETDDEPRRSEGGAGRKDRAGRQRLGAGVAWALLLVALGAQAMAQVTLQVAVLVDGRPVEVRPAGAWADHPALARRDGDRFVLHRPGERLPIAFAGGSALIGADDIGVWDLAHVLAVRVQRRSEDRYTFDVTVRHRDEGWEHYADLWRVVGVGVENGERVLLHPHDTEQPFTRSQSNVVARGAVTVEARDLLHGLGGTVIGVDLSAMNGDVRTVVLQVERID